MVLFTIGAVRKIEPGAYGLLAETFADGNWGWFAIAAS